MSRFAFFDDLKKFHDYLNRHIADIYARINLSSFNASLSEKKMRFIEFKNDCRHFFDGSLRFIRIRIANLDLVDDERNIYDGRFEELFNYLKNYRSWLQETDIQVDKSTYIKYKAYISLVLGLFSACLFDELLADLYKNTEFKKTIETIFKDLLNKHSQILKFFGSFGIAFFLCFKTFVDIEKNLRSLEYIKKLKNEIKNNKIDVNDYYYHFDDCDNHFKRFLNTNLNIDIRRDSCNQLCSSHEKLLGLLNRG